MYKTLYVVIPIYNEEAIIDSSIQRIVSVLNEADIPFHLVLVDDGSKDGTWEQLSKIASIREDTTALRLSRNFGKESAIFAGLGACEGACAAVMDCDMQHPAEILVEMYRLWEKCGYYIVEAVKSSRGKESFLSRVYANLFYYILRLLSGIDLKNSSDFRLMDQKVVDVVRLMPERQTFFRGMSSWVGYKRTRVLFDVVSREAGTTKWSKLKLCKFAFSSITSFSSIPLQLVTLIGIIFLIFGLGLAVQTLYMKFSGIATTGFTTVILLLLIVGSVLMLGLGIIGMYIAKIYEEVKQRPRYIVCETANYEGNKEKI